MTARNALVTLLIAIAISVGLSLGLSAFAQEQEPGPTDLEVEWAYRPADLSDLVEASPAIFTAEVEAVRASQPIDIAPGAEESVLIPTRLIDVRITELIDGEAPGRLTLHQLGGPGLHPTGDPGYHVGERYLLFALPMQNEDGTGPDPEGTWIPVAPDGRLERAAGELDAKIAGPIAERLDGATVAEAKAEIAAVEPGGGA